MFDFGDIRSASKDEQIRAWAVTQAVESAGGEDISGDAVVRRATAIENFVKNGDESSGSEA